MTILATGLSFVEVCEELAWLNATAHHEFHLPNHQEWDYMVAEVLPYDPDLTAPETKRSLRAQGTFATTSHGIVDLNGSVWEWTGECYSGATGSNTSTERCPAFFVGGEHIAAMSFLTRDPARGGCAVGSPPAHLGMRLVSDQRL